MKPWSTCAVLVVVLDHLIANQQMLHKVLAIKEQHLGEHHWQVACTLNNLAVEQMRLGDHRTQRELLHRALKIFQEHFGEGPFTVARTLMNLGIAYQELGQHDKAREVLERAQMILEQHFGQGHFEVAKTLTNLGITYRKLKDYDKAKDILERAVNIKVKHYGTAALRLRPPSTIWRQLTENSANTGKCPKCWGGCCLSSKITLELTMIAVTTRDRQLIGPVVRSSLCVSRWSPDCNCFAATRR